MKQHIENENGQLVPVTAENVPDGSVVELVFKETIYFGKVKDRKVTPIESNGIFPAGQQILKANIDTKILQINNPDGSPAYYRRWIDKENVDDYGNWSGTIHFYEMDDDEEYYEVWIKA
jgi:translation elongation factor P/translation initiation factor 5A